MFRRLPLFTARTRTLTGLQKRPLHSHSTQQCTLEVDALRVGTTRFPYLWLRDSCQSPSSVHPSTRQKLHRSSDFDLGIKPVTHRVVSHGDGFAEPGVTLVWPDGHQSHYTWEFLSSYASDSARMRFHGDVERVGWDAATLKASDSLFVEYDVVKQDKEGRLKAVDQLLKYGLLFIRGVPHKEVEDGTCELPRLANIFGSIRETFYGVLWDVKNKANSENIAYTNLHLGLHMDLLYYQEPPQFQILHCLRNRVVGGTSIFVDSLHASSVLRKTHPEAFRLLTQVPVPFHYLNAGKHYHHEHPTIQLAADGHSIAQVNYSPPFQAPLRLDTPPAFYEALKLFDAELNKETNVFGHTMKEGDAVLFDNRRALHARTAFTDNAAPSGDARRWLKGCYLEGDSVWDAARRLRAEVENRR
ncbi:gamma-butyrobetaine hydroxylase [Cylindrobasidium torrendii FP15055 ss-10]|uniref:Gamma-butyrobetaine hydroxylase n=1 Tax=Cylindrobasidium torrendii FP15055 ss-10 TaxID=1314674 RepID=A0A0D7B5R4_9AGAR|nr:gamma-butyrobetaine hydroxylase [Cylindrobasidium torrendii FP15055 ss-10]